MLSKRAHAYVLAAVTFSCLLAAGCDQRSAGRPAAAANTPSATASQIISGSAGSLAFFYSPRDLAARSEVVVVATVLGQKTVQDPADTTVGVPGVSVFTDTTVSVEQVVRDIRHLALGGTLIVRTAGGRVGDMSVGVEDQPAFTIGERVALFLKAGDRGRFTIVNGEESAVPVQNGTVTFPGDTPKSEAAFIAELQSA